MENKKFIKNVIAKLKKKNSENITIIPNLKVDFRKSPRMEFPTLDLTNDLLYEAKLNKRFLEEQFL